MGQLTIKESTELRKELQRVGVLMQNEEQTGAWKAHRKAAKKEITVRSIRPNDSASRKYDYLKWKRRVQPHSGPM
jgi:hypothetical protein